ncbi:MAG: helix-turn-helix domain-containing protein [Candidatus Azobacteroides sp.]|nr:helix-turn-helix domain-containing protein [Candidatus Azobacteroides sp.]
MEYKDILAKLIPAIEESLPKNSNYISRLANILGLTNRTVSRKLRGETQFNIEELMTLSRELGISLDGIAAVKGNGRHLMYLSAYDWSGETDYQAAIDEALAPYKIAAESSYSRYLVATSTYPDTIFDEFPLIAKFDYLKWLYFNKGYDQSLPLSEYAINREFHKTYHDVVLKFKQSIYILSNHAMINLAEEVLYFYQLKLLAKEEVLQLKDSFFNLLGFLEDICTKGHLPGNRKEMTFYYSEMNLPNDLIIIDSDNVKMVRMMAFFHNTLMAKDPESIEIIRQWYNMYLRMANIISISGELNRIKFFRKQHADLEMKLGSI